MNKNYQKELDATIKNIVKNGEVKTLLLHSCCAPCSSYVLEYLSKYFKITIFYYNPNIYPAEEYRRRVEEQKKFILALPTTYEVKFIEGKYEDQKFYKLAKGLENEKEGGERCFKCYQLRLNEAAVMAKEGNYDFFTTTLSISPYKNAKKLNEIGKELEDQYKISYLYSDFKKKEGYKRSIELSNIYNLYRQDYCGCVFSKNERELEKNIPKHQ